MKKSIPYNSNVEMGLRSVAKSVVSAFIDDRHVGRHYKHNSNLQINNPRVYF